MDDKALISKRLKELYNRAYMNNYPVFSDFLNMEEQSILAQLNLPCITYGGADRAERVVAGFGDYIDVQSFPIVCIKISPASQKFADKLTHRDFLGGIMNLGIERRLIGDIRIADNCGYVLCLAQIADYITDSLTRIKHTTVKTELYNGDISDTIQPESLEVIVSSCRLDAVIAAVCKLSRSESQRLFTTGKIYVNSRLTENTSYSVKEKDIISVRGIGRFEFVTTLRKTKKDRIVIEISRY